MFMVNVLIMIVLEKQGNARIQNVEKYGLSGVVRIIDIKFILLYLFNNFILTKIIVD